MNYWLMKSEPGAYSWDDLMKDGRTCWDGVRNYQARSHLMNMREGDLSLFYHSVNEKRIIGIARVVREYYPDHTDTSGKFGMVDIVPFAPVPVPVTLAAIKQEARLSELALVRQSRLSVMPIAPRCWQLLLAMGQYTTTDIVNV